MSRIINKEEHILDFEDRYKGKFKKKIDREKLHECFEKFVKIHATHTKDLQRTFDEQGRQEKPVSARVRNQNIRMFQALTRSLKTIVEIYGDLDAQDNAAKMLMNEELRVNEGHRKLWQTLASFNIETLDFMGFKGLADRHKQKLETYEQNKREYFAEDLEVEPYSDE